MHFLCPCDAFLGQTSTELLVATDYSVIFILPFAFIFHGSYLDYPYASLLLSANAQS